MFRIWNNGVINITNYINLVLKCVVYSLGELYYDHTLYLHVRF